MVPRCWQAASVAALLLGGRCTSRLVTQDWSGWLPLHRAATICHHRLVHCTSIADQGAVNLIVGVFMELAIVKGSQVGPSRATCRCSSCALASLRGHVQLRLCCRVNMAASCFAQYAFLQRCTMSSLRFE
ncbi:hypothetical protein COO60DRAFT_1556773 [Scenedesmus sp. NREL 46B-D3]|nr:hypothetical protein COO60DRAFT_1556773 [Scenedesmus sp. NREL 46B-D3]